ncbi:MAG: hypothetical protein R2741_08640 [Methanolobus sp.]
MKKRILLVLLILMLSASGCTEQGSNAQEEIDIADSLMISAYEMLEDIDPAYPSDAENRLYASQVSYEDALEILENIETKDAEQQKLIGIDIIRCKYSLESIEAEKHLIDCYTHLTKASSYISAEEYDKAHEEISLFNSAISEASLNAENAKELADEIDIDEVPIESKSDLIYERESIYDTKQIISEFSNIQAALNYEVNGLESYNRALENMDNEEWGKAEVNFNGTVSNLSLSNDIFIELQDSEYSEISTVSIEINSAFDYMITFSEHCETACGYMDDGKIRPANAEFELAIQSLSE